MQGLKKLYFSNILALVHVSYFLLKYMYILLINQISTRFNISPSLYKPFHQWYLCVAAYTPHYNGQQKQFFTPIVVYLSPAYNKIVTTSRPPLDKYLCTACGMKQIQH